MENDHIPLLPLFFLQHSSILFNGIHVISSNSSGFRFLMTWFELFQYLHKVHSLLRIFGMLFEKKKSPFKSTNIVSNWFENLYLFIIWPKKIWRQVHPVYSNRLTNFHFICSLSLLRMSAHLFVSFVSCSENITIYTVL